MEPNEVRNALYSDQVRAPVVQAGDIHGDVHLHAPGGTPLDLAAHELATAVRRQWTTEAENRSLRQPAPLQVRFWSTADSRQEPVRGDVRQIASMFRGLSRRQLVVLGEPGAGKTVAALLLTLELLESPRLGEPVPILLAAASWDPTAEHFDVWAIRRLTEDYPALGGQDTARLVADGRVMIVVDGLDELPVHLHAPALDGVNRASGIRPVVVTCRTDEYHAAVAQFGTFLSGAAVVQLAPVRADAVAAHIAETSLDVRWRPVTEVLVAEPFDDVAEVLSSPLMVYLARTAYASPRTEPRELLAFPTRAAIEQHLLNAYMPTVYGPRVDVVDMYRPRRRSSRWPIEDVVRWLAFLAKWPGQEFAWWHLALATPRWATGAVVSLAVLAVGCTPILYGRPSFWPALVAAAVSFVAITSRTRPIAPARPTVTRPNPHHLFRTITWIAAFVITPVAYHTAVFVFGNTVLFAVELSAAVGAGVLTWIGGMVVAERFRPRGVTLLDSRILLREDRRLCVLWLALAAAGFAVLLCSDSCSVVPLLFAVVAGCVGAAGRTAWMSYLVAKTWLALRAEVPWRLMTFLDDARQRGVLRANGPSYQFRHVRLREHLASRRCHN
ncbi:hypothetical protein SK803_09235 [Lentzea sp. BCCO 10_0856]|uniref:NACHT domain-containing protein n=1 Tax=Lentzea miocenica TaxID=3095431 RepID=A0ABU4SWV2_9PSEU|nr:hypothetical protein [Lentzea sp. BCCO 10_0856]MDX8030392.1 hypothetical protein [Lentzea sp. BCCO 10_0856]